MINMKLQPRASYLRLTAALRTWLGNRRSESRMDHSVECGLVGGEVPVYLLGAAEVSLSKAPVCVCMFVFRACGKLSGKRISPLGIYKVTIFFFFFFFLKTANRGKQLAWFWSVKTIILNCTGVMCQAISWPAAVISWSLDWLPGNLPVMARLQEVSCVQPLC